MTAYIALETGQVFSGSSVGVAGYRLGEIVFNTSLTGYQEIITDPSYSQQIITFTNPHIGNTGVNFNDPQSARIWASGIVMRSCADYTSNWRSVMSLRSYLQQNEVVALSEVNTRGLTRLIREVGSLRACIVADCHLSQTEAITKAKQYAGLLGMDLTPEVTSQRETCLVTSEDPKAPHVVVVNYGVKSSILRCLESIGCRITLVPALTSAQRIMQELKADGVLLSNGPGDPYACEQQQLIVKDLLNYKVPIFGICLGYQILALALGATTYKMRFGHHGGNHPVQELATKRIFITSQNHGFAVSPDKLPLDLEITHKSLFDHTVQGIRHRSLPIFGLQGHPEAGPGPQEAREYFADFISEILKIRLQQYHAFQHKVSTCHAEQI